MGTNGELAIFILSYAKQIKWLNRAQTPGTLFQNGKPPKKHLLVLSFGCG